MVAASNEVPAGQPMYRSPRVSARGGVPTTTRPGGQRPAHPAVVDVDPLRPGSVVLVGAACSVQFSGPRELRVRVVSVDTGPNYPGWIWLTGYVLGPTGRAVDRRELYVQRDGIQVIPPPPVTGPRRPLARSSPIRFA